MSLRKRPDWSRQLPRPLTIPGIMMLTRRPRRASANGKHLPKECRERATWRRVADQLDAAARGAVPRDVEAALILVLAIERVPCRPS